jgi:hypothetical protein
VTYGKDSWVELVEAPGAQPPVDGAIAQAAPSKLLPRHHPKLLLCELCHHGVASASPRQASIFDA